MLSGFRQRIGIKLFVLLATLIFLAIIPLAYVVFSSVIYLGQYAAEVNRSQIQQQAFSYLSRIADEQAHRYETFFNKVAVSSSLLATQAAQIYDNIEHYAALANGSPVSRQPAANGLFYSPLSLPVITAYWGDTTISPSHRREMQALTHLDALFMRTGREIEESLATHMISLSGIGRYYSDKNAARQAIYQLPPVEIFDLREGEPVTMYTGGKQPTDSTHWTQVYQDDSFGGLLVTASSPIVDNTGTLRGIAGIDVPLSNIVREVLRVESHHKENVATDKILFAFLVEQGGRIIAFPPEYYATFGLEIDLQSFRHSRDVMRLGLGDSRHAQVREMLKEILVPDGALAELSLNDGQYILASHMLTSLDWYLVLVTRQDDLLASVEQTEEALTGTLNLLSRKFIANGILISAILLLVVFLALGYFVSPLRRLSEAALRVGQGDMNTRCHLDRQDELGILADSFNDMVTRISEAERMRTDYAKDLEMTVKERTRDLRSKNSVLRQVIDELRLESERRKRAAEALRKSEERIRAAMDASLAGLCIVQNLQFKYVNPAIMRIFGYRQEQEMIRDIGPLDIVVPEQRALVRLNLLERASGKQGTPFTARCIRKDGSEFDALMGGAAISWNGHPGLVATMMDISEQKKTEAMLRERERELQRSLDEKEVLLREIYHRTKNNMLVIISMLGLQAHEISDEQVKVLFQETENRIRAMSLVHEKLYQSQNLSELDLGAYLSDMVPALVRNMAPDGRIDVAVNNVPVQLSIDSIVPLGLVVNELVMNSLKHAFPDKSPGMVFVSMKRLAERSIELQVGDDGIGLPVDIDIRAARSFGLQIITSLVEKQLQGTLDVSRNLDGGTTYCIRFSEPVRPKRI